MVLIFMRLLNWPFMDHAFGVKSKNFFVLLQRKKKNWSSDVNSWLIGQVPGAEIDWGQKEKRASEDEKLDGITDAMDMTLGKL